MKKILFMGDCNTSGIESDPSDNIANILGGMLREKGIEAQVTNLGEGMHTTREGVGKAKHYREEADVLILNYGLVDAWATSLPQFYVLYYPSNPVRKIARKLLKSLKKRLRGYRNVPRGVAVPINEYVANLNTIIAQIKITSPDMKVILWGTAPTRGDEKRDEDIKRYDAALRQLAETENMVFIDTRSLMADLPTKDAYKDEVHIKKKPQEIIAAKMLETF